jgi:hypothetical protein
MMGVSKQASANDLSLIAPEFATSGESMPRTDILGNLDKLYKKPGYNPFE